MAISTPPSMLPAPSPRGVERGAAIDVSAR
jgi:hypothetical protein